MNKMLDAIFMGSGVVATAVTATIQDVVGIILTCINIVYLVTIIAMRIIKKVKEAKADGVITPEEMNDIIDEAEKGKKQIEEEVNKHGKTK